MAEADYIRSCRQCGTELPLKARKSGRERLYCSDICRSRASSAVDKALAAAPPPDRQCTFQGCGRLTQANGLCVTHYSRMRSHGDPAFTKHGLRIDKPCGWCAAVMRLVPAKAARKAYCSRSCAMHGRMRDNGSCLDGIATFTCRGCAAVVSRKRKNGTDYCSIGCRGAHRTLLAHECAALLRIGRNWQWRPNKLVLAEVAALRRISRRPCVVRLTFRECAGGCGLFVRGYMEYSRTCQACRAVAAKAVKRRSKARRRAVERGLYADRIDPIKVFERDGWRCHLCGCKTPQALRGTYEANAPELDHVVPLALGGPHTWGNVKCSCRQCNGRKGANAMGQLGFDMAA